MEFLGWKKAKGGVSSLFELPGLKVKKDGDQKKVPS